MQKCGKILRGRKDTLALVVSTLRGERPRRPAVPTPLVFSSRGVNDLYQPVIGVVLTAIKWAFSVADTDVIHCRSDAVTRQLEHESTETVVYQRRLTKVPLVLIGKQWYQLPELTPTNSNSGVRSCISISIHTQHVT